jgi:hypothetical protein
MSVKLLQTLLIAGLFWLPTMVQGMIPETEDELQIHEVRATPTIVKYISDVITEPERGERDPLLSDGVGSPSQQAWRDQKGRSAPTRVRYAADRLWTAVDEESKAALHAGMGFPNTERSILDCLFATALCPCSLGVTLIHYLLCHPDNANHDVFQRQGKGYNIDMSYYQRDKFEETGVEVRRSLHDFKLTVNACVHSPEPYFGDAAICELGDWVRSSRWKRDDNKITCGQRDLSNVCRSVMQFVNTHGGWAS